MNPNWADEFCGMVFQFAWEISTFWWVDKVEVGALYDVATSYFHQLLLFFTARQRISSFLNAVSFETKLNFKQISSCLLVRVWNLFLFAKHTKVARGKIIRLLNIQLNTENKTQRKASAINKYRI